MSDEGQYMSVSKIVTKAELEEARINVEALTLVYMLKDLLLEADEQGRKVDLSTMRFSVHEDEFFTHALMYRIEARAT